MDGTRETDIPLENGTTYRLAGVDLGKTVKVRVSFTDDAGSAESVTSAAFPDGGVLAAAVCKAPTYEGGQREIWNAELRVGGGFQKGYKAGNPGGFGELSNDQFTHWNETLRITALALNIITSGIDAADFLSLGFDKTPTAVDFFNFEHLTLHLCDRAFNFDVSGGGEFVGLAHGMHWTRHRLDWSTYATRTVRLSVDEVVPTLVSSKLDGRSIKLKFSDGAQRERSSVSKCVCDS